MAFRYLFFGHRLDVFFSALRRRYPITDDPP